MEKLAREIVVCTFVLWLAEPAAADDANYRWEPEAERDGVRLFTSDAPGHDFDALRAVSLVAARPETLVAVLRDIENFPQWYADCDVAKVLERPSALAEVRTGADGKFGPLSAPESYVLFFLQKTPVIANRWAIIRNTLRVRADGTLSIAFSSLEHYPYSPPPGTERMSIRGSWELTPRDREHTLVALLLDIDLRASTPAFLVNPRLHAIAIDTMLGLRRTAALPKYSELGRRAHAPVR